LATKEISVETYSELRVLLEGAQLNPTELKKNCFYPQIFMDTPRGTEQQPKAV
jgi:hypothetical protein